ncbi:hypothetical protein HYPSUDRAFT_198714 [Hypholoma sublateritium FD-334 SS-4]|uniref:Uncharacterized protein n=1 Tax=Hypholoma sublateritium (strain FD-334 SS-4) TaxID=945553 RepID=A0A0D2Q5T5_HYPSF|nr:hypothetical protein HYPSUDRAFT_198714 [Hypholoma sublateritium FD-334 SS-4]
MTKRRRPLGLTDQDTAAVVNLLKRLHLQLDEDDEDGQEVVHALQTVVRRSGSFKTAAGCQTLINAIMLHDVVNLDTLATGVSIVPQFRIPHTPSCSGG